MPTVLAADSKFLLNAVDISAHLDTLTITESHDSLDITTFGQVGHRKRGGLSDGNIEIGGTYDTAVTGMHDVIKPLQGTVVAFDWRPEGNGTGKPATTGSVLVQLYRESGPVADIMRWTATLEIDGTVVDANQA